jgi:predicted RND superfamily exporter protein
MQKLALFVGFWTISMLVNVMMVFPLTIGFLPERASHARSSRVLGRHPVLSRLGDIAVNPRSRRVVWVASVIATVACIALSSRVSMGNPQPGTPLLWPDSPYNEAVAFYNAKFIGTDQLIVVLKGNGQDVRNLNYINAASDLQAQMQASPSIAGSVSFADFLPQIRRIFWGNYPKAEVLPVSDQESGAYTQMMQNGANPGDFDRFFDREYQHASITFFLKDTSTRTINAVVDQLRPAIDRIEAEYGIKDAFAIGLGSASLQLAVNEQVHFSHYASFIGGVILMLLTCLFAYRSLTLSFILVVPLVLTNFVVLATMALMNIGLDVNTLPIIAVGMGVGIDYGIYLMSRIIEEAGRREGPSVVGSAVRRSLETTGSAIWLTAITMVFSVGVWYFLSDLRFQAEMGLLLALIMLVNLVGALLLVPVQVMTFGTRAVLARAAAGGTLAH